MYIIRIVEVFLLFGKMKGKKSKKKQESNLVTKESLCATCATFSFLALLVLCSKAWIFGEVGETVHIFLTGVFGYFAYPVFLGIMYLSITCLFGKRLVKNRKLGRYIALCVIFLGLVAQTAMTYSWDSEDYVTQCFLSGTSFPDTTVCGAVGGYIIDKVATVLTRRGVIVLFSVLAAFFACLCCIMVKKPASATSVKENAQTETTESTEENEYPQTVVVGQSNRPQSTIVEQDLSMQTPSLGQNASTPADAEDFYALPTMQQRPVVVLGGDRDNVKAPNVASTQTAAQDTPFDSREFLFGTSPAENYQRNLIFDPNSRVNRRIIDGGATERESVYVPSYSNSYETTLNEQENVSPAVVQEESWGNDAAYTCAEPQQPVSTPSYTIEESYLDESFDEEPTYETSARSDERENVGFSREESTEEMLNFRDDTPPAVNDTPVEKPYERHDYMSLFSPSNPRVFGDREEDTVDRFGSDYEERGSSSRDSFLDRDRQDDFEERGGRDGSRLLDDEEPYTLRTEYDEDISFRRDMSEERGRGVEITETPVARDMDIRGRGVEEVPAVVEAPKPVEPSKPRVIQPYKRVPLDDFDCRDIEPTANQEEVEATKAKILATLEEFKVTGASIASVTFGPTVTRYNVSIPLSIPPKKVVALDQSIAISLHSKAGVNIYPNFEDGVVSIEVPNKERQFVQLGCMLSGDTFVNAKNSSIMFAMGKDVANRKVYGDISKMVHLLVAGSTNSGKSVFLGALIISLIYKYSPEELRLILIDPKKTEFVLYNNLPHLMINEIITDAGKAVQSLNWAVGEMNRRYGLFEQMSRAGTYVVNLDQYNEKIEKEQRLPKIVIIIDELADLMLTAKKEMEDRIQSLTQKARAAGIHLIVATQRPSTDVITGVIKSNLPTRIAFSVATDVDSRVILDQTGAQKLLGKGDLLYTMPGLNLPVRVQSAFISPEDSQRVVNFIKNNNEAYYDEEATAYINSRGGNGGTPSDPFDSGNGGDTLDPVYIDALRYVILSNSASISMIQRKCTIGYNRAGKVIEWMEDMGYISPFDGAKARKVLITKEEFESKYGPL